MSTHTDCGTPLNPAITDGMEWRYCPSCTYYVHAPCGNQTCSCGKEKASAPRAQKVDVSSAALAIWGTDEVGSPSNENEARNQAQSEAQLEAPSGAQRPHMEGPNMAATKKSTEKKAAEPKAKVAKADDKRASGKGRGRGELEALVVEVTDAFDAGKIDLPDGKTLTPQTIARLIGEKPGEDRPSGGAVAAILNRWEEAGYALTHDKPYAFKAVSAKGKKQGLADLKAKLKEKKAAERKAEREAKAS